MHSKFWLLHFKPLQTKGTQGTTADVGDTDESCSTEVVRIIVSSGNANPGSYGASPDTRQLCGLFWA